MIFIFAVLACIVVEGSALDISLRCNKIFRALNNDPVSVTQTPVTINLKDAGVPDDADDVVVFAYIQTGHLQRSGSNFFAVNLLDVQGSVSDAKKLFYTTYDQQAWSYNSENIVFPIEIGHSSAVQAKIEGITGSNFAANIQVTGYYITQCAVIS